MAPETCGRGVAEQAILPSRLADLTESMAAVLEFHQQALDRTDSDSRSEFEAYEQVARALRRSASELKATSSRMAESRPVPMGQHDMEALSSPQAVQIFAGFVQAEGALLALLQVRMKDDRRMLAELRGGDGDRR